MSNIPSYRIPASLSELVTDTSPQLGGDLDLNGFALDFPTTPNISDCLDEDNMASDSATKLATQQSIKAYVDTYAGGGSGDLKADGSVPLTANWDVGAYTITALRFASDQATGTAPFTVASTTVVANLNASLLEGNAAAAFQAYDAELAALAGLTFADDKMIIGTGAGTVGMIDCTAFAQSILDDADEATFKATVNLEIGTDVQAYDAELAALAGLTFADDQIIIGTGAGTVGMASCTVFAQSILDDADEATFKATVNLEIGTDVQAFHAYLADIAGLTAAQGDILYFNGTDIVNLGPGVAGKYLKTQGAAANPIWDTPAGAGDVLADGSVPFTSTVFIAEQAAAEADQAGHGQIWVKTGAPSTLWFVNESGTEVQLGVGGAAGGGWLVSQIFS